MRSPKYLDATRKPDWFDYQSTITDVRTELPHRRQLTITGTASGDTAFHVAVYHAHPNSDQWVISCYNSTRRFGDQYRYIALNTKELEVAFGVAWDTATLDRALAERFDAEYAIPRVFARTRKYLVLPGPTSTDLLWAEDTLTVSIELSTAIRKLVRELIRR